MKEQIESAMKRQVGDAAFAQKLGEHFAAQDDLFSTCQRCRQQIKGKLSEIELHVLICGGDDGKGS
jgi:hypothetical protein